MIEPGVSWRLFALDYTVFTRWTHYLGTQAILVCFFLLTCCKRRP